MKRDYAEQSRDGPVTLLCPHEPGSLQGCYYGRWSKDSTTIVTVDPPGQGDCEPARRFTTTDPKYHLNRATFSLTITSVAARTDSGSYMCELMALDPASPVGTMDPVFRSVIEISLTIDGKSNHLGILITYIRFRSIMACYDIVHLILC